MNFSIIIPNLNGAHLLPSCLKSILESTSKSEVILVDNGSTDNSISTAKKFFPRLKIIQNKTNRGFAFACNQGILAAKYPYVVICNNDITIDPNYFKLISQTIKKHPQAAAFVGTTLNKTGKQIESTGLNFNYCGKCTHLKKNYQNQQPQPIWGAAAALVVYKKEIIKNAGMFDAKFFAYEEDVDLALRLHNLNCQTIWEPQALAYHLGGATSAKMANFRQRMDVKNWIYIIIKNYSSKQILKNFPCIIEQRLRNLSGLLKNTPFLLWLPTLISVYGQVLINLPYMFQQHQKINQLIENCKLKIKN